MIFCRCCSAEKYTLNWIEPTFIEQCDLKMPEEYVRDLLSVMKQKRFVLSNSDSCPPGVAYEKFLLVSSLVKEMKGMES